MDTQRIITYTPDGQIVDMPEEQKSDISRCRETVSGDVACLHAKDIRSLHGDGNGNMYNKTGNKSTCISKF